MTAPYTALAKVYDRWTADNDYGRWAEFIISRLPDPARRTVRVLDVCCGTGTMSKLLARSGYAVTGADQSEAMLNVARAAAPSIRFVRAALPDEIPGEEAGFDAAVCTFDSLNYLAAQGAVQKAFMRLAEVIQPGGAFIFDINTRHKLEDVFGDSHYGDDRGDFAYVWRNRCDKTAHTVEFLITLFTKQGDIFVRETEHHVQRWFDRDELAAAAGVAGFTIESVTDDYTDAPGTDQAMRETWVLRRAGPRLQGGDADAAA